MATVSGGSALPVSRGSSEAATQGTIHILERHAVVADQEEDVEGLEAQGLDHEHVCRPDELSVVARKVRHLWLGGRAGPRDR
jgi:hypothetical protein